MVERAAMTFASVGVRRLPTDIARSSAAAVTHNAVAISPAPRRRRYFAWQASTCVTETH
jgi:hypothetical protein